MTITREQREDLLEATKPLWEWLSENCHPHVTVIVDVSRVELLEGVAIIAVPPTEE